MKPQDTLHKLGFNKPFFLVQWTWWFWSCFDMHALYCKYDYTYQDIQNTTMQHIISKKFNGDQTILWKGNFKGTWIIQDINDNLFCFVFLSLDLKKVCLKFYGTICLLWEFVTLILTMAIDNVTNKDDLNW